MSEPVLVLYKSDQCGHCINLASIWNTPKNKDEDSVVNVLKKTYPKLRFFTISTKDNKGEFDENSVPKDMIRYGRWFPMVVLVPGKIWDEAMSKLGPKNDVKIVDGVQVMNGAIENGNVMIKHGGYDIRKSADFGRWLKDAMSNEDFRRVQYGESGPIKPFLTQVVKPPQTIQLAQPEIPSTDNICSMKIISRIK